MTGTDFCIDGAASRSSASTLAGAYPDDVFDILEALKRLLPDTAAGFSRGTGGVSAEFIVRRIDAIVEVASGVRETLTEMAALVGEPAA